jgi:hypothetical protein
MNEIKYTPRPDSPPDITLKKHGMYLGVSVWYDLNLFHIDTTFNSDTEVLTRIGVNKKYFYTASSYLEEILCTEAYSVEDRHKIMALLIEKSMLQ